MEHKEYQFQICVVDWLYGRTRKGNKTYPGNPPMPGLLFTHHYAGRTKEDGYFLQQLGVRPGIGDILNWWHDGERLECGMLELKVDADMSSSQHKVKGTCIQLGIKYELARTPAQVIAVYHKWGLKPLHEAIRTPDYRTFDDKKKESFDMQKPLNAKIEKDDLYETKNLNNTDYGRF